jgi:hypothetical protein
MVGTDPSVMISNPNDRARARSESEFEDFRLTSLGDPTILGGFFDSKRAARSRSSQNEISQALASAKPTLTSNDSEKFDLEACITSE